MDKTADRITAALRDALTAYSRLEASGQDRVVVELFGLRQSKHAAPLLDELARISQSAHEQ